LDSVLARFLTFDSSAVSDALDRLALPSGLVGIGPTWGAPKLVGRAVTVQLEQAAAGLEDAHICSTAIAEASAGDVIVVANDGRTDVSSWGGLLSLGASLRGVRGALVDGACRDVDEARELGFPVYARGTAPVTARGRLRQRSTGEPVRLGPVTVHAGDVIVADEVGVVVVPADRAEEALAEACEIVAREQAIAVDLRAGVPLPDAMRDARLAGAPAHRQGSRAPRRHR
jgi:regulator of RNase E activity RraA